MREEILRMCLAAVEPGTVEVPVEDQIAAVAADPERAAQFLRLLDDLQPLPVVRALRAEMAARLDGGR